MEYRRFPCGGFALAVTAALRLLIGILLPMAAIAQNQVPARPISPKPSVLTPSAHAPHQPITQKQRVAWFLDSSFGPQSLAAGVFSAGIGTWRDKPVEYDTHWDGFGKRYGMRLTGVASGNAIEAGIGSLWGEDPRYFRVGGRSLSERIRNVIVMTAESRRRNGRLGPAYARYIGTAGNNFISNTWRAQSESTVDAALMRTAIGFAGRMGYNAFHEFWPDIEARVPLLRRWP